MSSRNRTVLGLALVLVLAALLGWRLLVEDAREVDVALLPLERADPPVEALTAAETSLPAPPDVETRAPADSTLPQILVVREDGAPVAEARAVIFSDRRVLDEAVTDSAGRAHFDDPKGAARVLIQAAGHALFLTELDPARRSSRVVLPDGQPFRGMVEVDGAPPLETIALRLHSDGNRALPAELPSAVTRRLGRTPEKRAEILIRPEADGSFVVRGLPANARGRFECDAPWFLDDGWGNTSKCSTDPFALNDGMLLALSRTVEFRVRVVRSDGGPVLLDSVLFEDGPNSGTMKETKNVFACRIRRGSPRRISVMAFLTGFGPEPITREFGLPGDPPEAWGILEFEVPAPPMVWVEVLGPEGGLLTEATAFVDPSTKGWPVTGEFDAGRKRLRVEFSPDAEGFFVKADGHHDAWLALPIAGDEARATLERRCSLSVSIPGCDPSQADFRLTLTSREPMVPAIPAAPPRVISNYRHHGPRQPTLQASPLTVEMDSKWRHDSLQAGVPLRLEIHDRRSKPAAYATSGTALVRMDIAPLAPGEQRAVVVELGAEPRFIDVRMLWIDGAPAADVYVSAVGSKGDRKSSRTDSRGIVRVGPLYGDLASLWFWNEDLPIQVRRDVPVGSGEITIPLEPPRTIEVEVVGVVDAKRSPGPSVAIDFGEDRPRHGRRSRSGVWTIDRLPPGEVLIEVTHGSRSVRQIHDTSIRSARVVLGEPGRISVKWHVEPADDAPLRTVAIAPAGSATATSRARPSAPNAKGDHRWFLSGLPLGAYELWPEESSRELPHLWKSVGPSRRVVLDREHPSGYVDWTP